MIKKIGIVANTAFNIYNFRLGLMQYLKQQGYEVIAIAPSDEYAQKICDTGFQFVEIKNLARKGTNPLRDMMLMNELRGIYSKQKIDVALQYTIKPNIYGTIAAKFSGTKTICTVTGLGYTFLNESTASIAARFLYKLSFSFAGKVLFQNSDDRRIFIEEKLVDEKKTAIIPGSGINTKYFHPDFCGNKNDDGMTHFLMISRFLKDKGIYEYIEAAQKMKAENQHVQFHLAGEVDLENPSSISQNELQQWIDQKIIIYEGYVEDTRPVICQSDCVVLPSYREGMPRVILEGMAMGRPCITSDAPGCKDSIDSSCGFLARVADADSLSKQMSAFFDLCQNKRSAMGVAARRRAENIYEENIIFIQYLSILQNS